MDNKLREERLARQRAENQMLEVEKQRSMLDVDLKQYKQKVEQLSKQKERLEEEVRTIFKNILEILFLIFWNI